MKTARNGMDRVKETLERKVNDLAQMLLRRDGIVIEKSADHMDELQYASERDLAIQNVDYESAVLREVRSALLRLQNGAYGVCDDCGLAISPKRLKAVPWALYCIQCQETAERQYLSRGECDAELPARAAS